ncbi:MAG: aldo/keto reductase [Proteobacteria bacterium]|nr:aldo/keto reductase [Pseudomonadota bacterium]MDA1058419.1 aldo/keto reductase [Pseudomonadota bacterium]
MDVVTTHGAAIPKIGFGTFPLKGDDARRMVGYALKAGYRHIDTAQMYGNEAEVGEAIAHAGLGRDAVFLTTKVWPDNFGDGPLQKSVEESLKKLRVDAVDLLLLHWPKFERPIAETVAALNAVHDAGLARHIGVSNFTTALIGQAWSTTKAPLINDQVEYHPYLNQGPVLGAVRKRGMSLTAYMPNARGKVFEDETLGAIGMRHGKTAGQVALRWLYQQDGIIAIPRTASEAHADENIDVLDFALSDQEMTAVFAIARPDGRLLSPPGIAPVWDRA